MILSSRADGIAQKHEIMNFTIAFTAMVLAVYVFNLALASGLASHVAVLVDRIRILLKLMPEHIIRKLVGGNAYSIVPVNIAIFIIINFVLGMVAFKLIRQRGTKYSGLIYGIFMSLIFLALGSAYTILSRDPFNWLVVMVGVPITIIVQVPMATYLLRK